MAGFNFFFVFDIEKKWKKKIHMRINGFTQVFLKKFEQFIQKFERFQKKKYQKFKNK